MAYKAFVDCKRAAPIPNIVVAFSIYFEWFDRVVFMCHQLKCHFKANCFECIQLKTKSRLRIYKINKKTKPVEKPKIKAANELFNIAFFYITSVLIILNLHLIIFFFLFFSFT